MGRMNEGRVVKMMVKAVLSGHRLRGRPIHGWINGIKQPMGWEDISVKQADNVPWIGLSGKL